MIKLGAITLAVSTGVFFLAIVVQVVTGLSMVVVGVSACFAAVVALLIILLGLSIIGSKRLKRRHTIAKYHATS